MPTTSCCVHNSQPARSSCYINKNSPIRKLKIAFTRVLLPHTVFIKGLLNAPIPCLQETAFSLPRTVLKTERLLATSYHVQKNPPVQSPNRIYNTEPVRSVIPCSQEPSVRSLKPRSVTKIFLLLVLINQRSIILNLIGGRSFEAVTSEADTAYLNNVTIN
jgi:hypothetical protein